MNANNAIYCSNFFCKRIIIYDYNTRLLNEAVNNYKGHTITSIDIIVQSARLSKHTRNFEDIGKLAGTFQLKIHFKRSKHLEITNIPENIAGLQIVNDSPYSSIIIDRLPTDLKKLSFIGKMSNLVLPSCFPPLLHTLDLPRLDGGESTKLVPLDSLPPTLKELRIGALDRPFNMLPQGLRVLKVHLLPKVKCDYPLTDFPPSLEHLCLLGGFTSTLGDVPSSLRILELEFSTTIMPPLG